VDLIVDFLALWPDLFFFSKDLSPSVNSNFGSKHFWL